MFLKKFKFFISKKSKILGHKYGIQIKNTFYKGPQYRSIIATDILIWNKSKIVKKINTFGNHIIQRKFQHKNISVYYNCRDIPNYPLYCSDVEIYKITIYKEGKLQMEFDVPMTYLKKYNEEKYYEFLIKKNWFTTIAYPYKDYIEYRFINPDGRQIYLYTDGSFEFSDI